MDLKILANELKKLDEGRSFSLHTVSGKQAQINQKNDLLKACGYTTELNGAKLIVTFKDGTKKDIWDDTGVIKFFYNPDKIQKWKDFYHKLFKTEGSRKDSHVNKDGTKVYGEERKRYTPGDFLLKSNLKKRLMEYGIEYRKFIQDLANDVEVKEYI